LPRSLTTRAPSNRRARATGRGTTWARFCRLALKLPGVETGTSYGTPALHVYKRFLARLKENGEDIAIRVGFADRDVLLELDPRAFYLTDHYRPYPAMLLRMKEVRRDLLERLIEQAWREGGGDKPRGAVRGDKPRRAARGR
jgi:hypothetical protein